MVSEQNGRRVVDQRGLAATEDRFGALRYLVYTVAIGALALVLIAWVRDAANAPLDLEVLLPGTALALTIIGLGVYGTLVYGGPTAVQIETSDAGIAVVFPNGRRRHIPWRGEGAFLVLDHSALPSPSALNPTGKALIQEPLRSRTYVSKEAFEFLISEAISKGWIRSDQQLSRATIRSTLRGQWQHQ
jgi:hypothetical protein